MPLKTFDEYVTLAEAAHGHMCAGQILGLRLAIYGVTLLGIDDPAGKDRKRLVSFVEIDRCATDAVPIVTGCRMGKRALKFRDFGKAAGHQWPHISLLRPDVPSHLLATLEPRGAGE